MVRLLQNIVAFLLSIKNPVNRLSVLFCSLLFFTQISAQSGTIYITGGAQITTVDSLGQSTIYSDGTLTLHKDKVTFILQKEKFKDGGEFTKPQEKFAAKEVTVVRKLSHCQSMTGNDCFC